MGGLRYGLISRNGMGAKWRLKCIAMMGNLNYRGGVKDQIGICCFSRDKSNGGGAGGKD